MDDRRFSGVTCTENHLAILGQRGCRPQRKEDHRLSDLPHCRSLSYDPTEDLNIKLQTSSYAQSKLILH